MLCTASFTPGVPRWLTGKGSGWVTAEYAMLPRATNERNDRESVKGRVGGRTHEISRLVGRALRAIIDTKALGENTIVIDCDVLQPTGGTRTASITGAYVALADAIAWGKARGHLPKSAEPLIDSVAAISVGIVDGVPLLDLQYSEDSRAETDMNVVVTGRGLFVEVQGTAEGAPFDKRELDELLDLAVREPQHSRSSSSRRSVPEGSAGRVGAQRPYRDRAAGSRCDGFAVYSTRDLRVVLATRNAHKVGELTGILGHRCSTGIELVPLPDDAPDPVEDAPTFAGNALVKAPFGGGVHRPPRRSRRFRDRGGRARRGSRGHSARYAGHAERPRQP